MTASNIPTQEQGGVSAQKAIEYLQPIIQRILDDQDKPDGKKNFSKDFLASFKSMSQDELMLLGHRLDTLASITNMLLSGVAMTALAGLVKDEPIDPSLS